MCGTRYLQGIERENKKLYEEWKEAAMIYDQPESIKNIVEEQRILRYQISEYKYETPQRVNFLTRCSVTSGE